MSPAENKALVRSAVDEILNNGNLAFVDEAIASDYVNHGTQGDAVGREVIKLFVAALRESFPDLYVEVDEMVAEGDRVAWRRSSRGTHRSEFMGVPATGELKTWQAIHITRIAGGMIVEEWGIWDFPQRFQGD